MKALLAGYGGIGANVYYPELKKLGYDVDVLDTVAKDVAYSNIDQIKIPYDLAVICTPNFTHEGIAKKLAQQGAKRIFVEKPGVKRTYSWDNLQSAFPKTQFHLVKNNLYRNDYGQILVSQTDSPLVGVDITWFNKNRIPNPGSWFTDKELAFGGISRDLMPHLYCFAYKIFGDVLFDTEFIQHSYQRWNLQNITSSDYGKVNPDGIYNVDDYATAYTEINRVSLRLNASWKEGYDKQSITMFYKDGSTYEWEFGLCPAEAYGVMLQDTSNSRELDYQIHYFLENFDAD